MAFSEKSTAPLGWHPDTQGPTVALEFHRGVLRIGRVERLGQAWRAIIFDEIDRGVTQIRVFPGVKAALEWVEGMHAPPA